MQNLAMAQREIIYLDIDKICPNPYQHRKMFDKGALDGLSASIEKYGIIEPIIVRYLKGGSYELVSGERRLKACKILGMGKIPTIIINVSEKDSMCISFAENVQRENLNFIEEAEGFQSLMVDFGYTKEEIEKFIGKKYANILNKLTTLKFKKEIKVAVIENNLTEKHTNALLKLNDEDVQMEVLEKIIKFGLSASNTEKLVEMTLKNMSEFDGKQNPNKDMKLKGYVTDIRLFTNTIKNAVDIMKQSGINTKYSIIKNGKEYEINIKLDM